MHLRLWMLTLALGLSFLYAIGLFFVLTGSPIKVFTDILDAVRTAMTIGWFAYIVVAARDYIVDHLRIQALVASIGREEAPERRQIHAVR